MSMKDLKDINEVLEVVEKRNHYPRLALILVKDKITKLYNKLYGLGVDRETLVKLENARYLLEVM